MGQMFGKCEQMTGCRVSPALRPVSHGRRGPRLPEVTPGPGKGGEGAGLHPTLPRALRLGHGNGAGEKAPAAGAGVDGPGECRGLVYAVIPIAIDRSRLPTRPRGGHGRAGHATECVTHGPFLGLVCMCVQKHPTSEP